MMLFSRVGGGPLSPRASIESSSTRVRRRGITKHVYPYSLRHAAATHLLERHQHCVIQQLTGHRSLRTTQLYAAGR